MLIESGVGHLLEVRRIMPHSGGRHEVGYRDRRPCVGHAKVRVDESLCSAGVGGFM